MSKRAGAVSADTKERILQAAKDEFSRQSFQGSSLRRICTAAGVTTGALYFFFEGKDDLFRTILSQVTVPFLRFMEQHYAMEQGAPGGPPEGSIGQDLLISRQLIDFYFSNRQTWDILRDHLNHPAVREFLEGFADISTEHYLGLLKKAGRPNIDPFAIHQFVHMQEDTMLTLISHDFSREDMIAHSGTVVRMLRAAFQALLSD